MTLRSRSSRCEGHTRFWPLCPRHRTDFHQTWNSTCTEHWTSFSDLEVKVIPKVKGHFNYWLLCLYLWTDSHQTWNRVCLEYGYSIHDLEVKVIQRSKVKTEDIFEWLAILFFPTKAPYFVRHAIQEGYCFSNVSIRLKENNINMQEKANVFFFRNRRNIKARAHYQQRLK